MFVTMLESGLTYALLGFGMFRNSSWNSKLINHKLVGKVRSIGWFFKYFEVEKVP